MAEIAIVGAGMGGLVSAMLLAGDGHQVTVIERDVAAPPEDPTRAWDEWDRTGVNQFYMSHLFLSRFRAELAKELPHVLETLRDAGMLKFNVMDGMPDEMKGGVQPGDERFDCITGRRPVMEAVVAGVASRTDGVTISRGQAVVGLLTNETSNGSVPHVCGLKLEGGDDVRADLVVDAGGRRSPIPRLLADAGAAPVHEESDDSGFMYYSRAFASTDGSLPIALGPGLQYYDSISILLLPADHGTWAPVIVARADDAQMRKVLDADRWMSVMRSYRLAAHWVDAEPVSDVTPMAKIEDRIRHLVVDGEPVATGVVAVGDAWSCTNPSLGRGASVAIMHATELRDHLRTVDPADARAFAVGWHERTVESVEPYYRDTLRLDRHRLAEISAQINGRPYDHADDWYARHQAVTAGVASDPHLLRAVLDMAMLMRPESEVLNDPAVIDRISTGARPEPPPGPSRSELVDLLES